MLKHNQEMGKPYISSNKNIDEITIKSVLLGIILCIILASSSIYLGLKAGQTISASIPAAVISMTILRFFRNATILENNIVQTIASAGQAGATGIIFTLPALVMMGYWKTFQYWQIVLIAVAGGTIGVLVSIPLRRIFIIEQKLSFPDGIVTAEVLKMGDNPQQENGKLAFSSLIKGTLVSAVIQLCQNALQIMSDSIKLWYKNGSFVIGGNIGFSMAILGAGYIIGFPTILSLIFGAVSTYGIALPLYVYFGNIEGIDTMSAYEIAMHVRIHKLRYIGVGAMIIGGLYTVYTLINPMKDVLRSSFASISKISLGEPININRTQHDIPMIFVLLGLLVLMVPVFFIIHYSIKSIGLPFGDAWHWFSVIVITIAALVATLVASAIGGYTLGAFGVQPLSGIVIVVILLISSICLMLFSGFEASAGKELAAAVIIISGVVSSASVLSGDNLQDLKSGYLLGATPWKQQVTLLIGVVTSALVIAPVLTLLYDAYGIGDSFPRPGMDPNAALAAPQAILMTSVTNGVFSQTIEWSLLMIGMLAALAVIALDYFLLKIDSKHRISVMAVALSMYLPLEITTPLIMGGLIHLAVTLSKQPTDELSMYNNWQSSLMFCAGLVVGDAISGILLAIPFASYERSDLFAIVGPDFKQISELLSLACTILIAYYLYRLGAGKQKI